MNTKRLLAYGIVAIVVIALGAYGIRYLGDTPQSADITTPSPSTVGSATPTNTPTVSKVPGKIELPPGVLTADYYKQFKGPATCAVEGSVKFINPSTAANSAKISYTGIDSQARQITWSISPQAPEMHIGPNIFASLPLPNGSQQVIVVLPKNPTSKTYSLKAKVTYGRLVGEGIKVSEVACSGTINVERNY
jgi:hypothetical protein